jgi:hypothetical protein
MKTAIFSMIALGMFACGTQKGGSTYGEKIDTTKAETVDVALKAFENSGKSDAVIKGQISQVCTGEGCWYTLKHGNTEQFVGFEKFTIPKEVAGRMSVASGRFYRDTQSVEAQREGLSEAEAAKITEPKISVQFTATGIVIK